MSSSPDLLGSNALPIPEVSVTTSNAGQTAIHGRSALSESNARSGLLLIVGSTLLAGYLGHRLGRRSLLRTMEGRYESLRSETHKLIGDHLRIAEQANADSTQALLAMRNHSNDLIKNAVYNLEGRLDSISNLQNTYDTSMQRFASTYSDHDKALSKLQKDISVLSENSLRPAEEIAAHREAVVVSLGYISSIMDELQRQGIVRDDINQGDRGVEQIRQFALNLQTLPSTLAQSGRPLNQNRKVNTKIDRIPSDV